MVTMRPTVVSMIVRLVRILRLWLAQPLPVPPSQTKPRLPYHAAHLIQSVDMIVGLLYECLTAPSLWMFMLSAANAVSPAGTTAPARPAAARLQRWL